MDADISIGKSNGSDNGGTRSNSTTIPTTTTTTATSDPTTASARPVLPQRSKSTLTAPPPADATKPDDMAVADVYQQVDQLGSLEAAARKLSRYAKKQAWEDDPEEREYLASNTKRSGLEANSGTSTGNRTGISAGKEDKGLEVATGKMTLAQQRMMQAFQDEQDGDEGAGMQVDEEDYEVFADDDDDDDDDDDNDGNHEVVHLQEVEDGLWIGDVVAAMDTAGLQARGIQTNIVSLLRPRLTFPDPFAVYALEIDDSMDTDILTHLPGAVQWIQQALDRRQAAQEGRDVQEGKAPGGVFIHCQAGVSRSATVTAAWLMRSKDLDPDEAIEMIQQHRPQIDPSQTFRHQLELFHQANGRVSLKDKPTRRFYMERTTTNIMNGDGSAPPMDKMAKFPATPTPSQPPTPMGGHGRRKIRCKMCRRHLAVREHMMDHILDQAPMSRPRTPSNFALPSPRMSFSNGSSPTTTAFPERRKSIVSDVINPLTGLPGAVRSRQGSMSTITGTAPLSALSPISPNEGIKELEIKPASEKPSEDTITEGEPVTSPRVPLPKSLPQSRPSLVMTEASPESITGGLPNFEFPANPLTSPPSVSSPLSASRSLSTEATKIQTQTQTQTRDVSPASTRREYQSADQLNSRLPPHLLALRHSRSGSGSANLSSPIGSSPASSPEREVGSPFANGGPLSSNAGVSANANAGALSRENSTGGGGSGVNRRRSLLAMTSTGQQQKRERQGSASSEAGFGGSIATGGPPILANPKCSGYFVEPLTWMEPVLRNGDISGKIVCPNEKCGVKIGNFDWAGVQCGCKEWVTPGFCIHRSKVDEVW